MNNVSALPSQDGEIIYVAQRSADPIIDVKGRSSCGFAK
jgi:hypothetical protein